MEVPTVRVVRLVARTARVEQSASSHRDGAATGEAGRRPRPRNPPERGSVGDRRGNVPSQPLGYTRGMLAPPH